LDKFFAELRFEHQTAIVRTTDGFDITVTPNELIGRHIYLTGEFDRSIVEILTNFSERSDVLLDIGANIGYVSSCFLNNVPNSSVIAVEPQREVLELLTTNLNRFGRSKIYPYAISNRDGEAWFQVNRGNMGAGRIVEGCDVRTIKIQTRTADSLFDDMHIERVDLVKIDAEGAEEAILSSSLARLERMQPKAIVFEDNGGAAANITSMLMSIGYTVFGIRKSLLSLHLERGPGFHDYIALSNNRTLPERATKLYRLT
jgi:FkbM family methyltransferase